MIFCTPAAKQKFQRTLEVIIEKKKDIIEGKVKLCFFVLPLLVILIDEVILDLQTYRLSSQENLEMNEFSLIAICGIFNQRNQIFGGSAGKQCTCISLYSTMPSEMKETGK